MALGPPDIGTATPWYSQYDGTITDLLTRLQDNASNAILAKDVRDPVWTLYNQILMVASQSLTQSSLYSLATPSTVDIGGIGLGSTFSYATLNQLFDMMLLPYVAPQITSFMPSTSLYQFGQTTPLSISYDITLGSVPISVKNFTGPYLPIPSDPATGLNPDTGTKASIVPTFSSTVQIQQYNIFTMSVVTADSLSFSTNCSIVYEHKRYYGNITLPMGFTAGSSASIVTIKSYLTDSVIKGLSYSELSIDTNISQSINFNHQYFVFAAPTIFGFNFPNGFFMNNIFSQDFVKIKSGATFSNEYSYVAPYDVWLSANPFYDNILVSSVSNPSGFNGTYSTGDGKIVTVVQGIITQII